MKILRLVIPALSSQFIGIKPINDATERLSSALSAPFECPNLRFASKFTEDLLICSPGNGTVLSERNTSFFEQTLNYGKTRERNFGPQVLSHKVTWLALMVAMLHLILNILHLPLLSEIVTKDVEIDKEDADENEVKDDKADEEDADEDEDEDEDGWAVSCLGKGYGCDVGTEERG